MSTIPILPTFTNGQQGSAAEVMEAFQTLYNAGALNFANLNTLRTQSLLEFERRISYLNSKQQQSTKITNENSLVNFSLTDFSTVDQSETTATMRIDTSVASCSEQNVEVEAVIKSIVFSSTVGSIEVLNSNSNVYRVYNTNSQIPTGTFLITLTQLINLSVLVFDLPSIAGNPVIKIGVSNTGITYNPIVSYSLNGYRLVVYLDPAPIQYISLSITPNQPDNLGGSLFTFGVTDFVGNSTEYRLLSEFVSQPLSFRPSSLNCELSAVTTSGLLYFLSLNGGNYIEVDLNQTIPIPGVSAITAASATLNTSGLLSSTLSATIYSQTLKIIDNSTGLAMPILYGILPTNTLIANLTTSYISVVGTSLYYIPYISADSTKTFKITYIEGPSSMTAQLKVQLSTSASNISPIFNGAVLLSA